jgi:valyl-tRNA synthetase
VITKEQQERTERELEKSRKELESLDAKLVNEQFMKNAPPAIVEGARVRQAELRARIEKLSQNQ